MLDIVQDSIAFLSANILFSVSADCRGEHRSRCFPGFVINDRDKGDNVSRSGFRVRVTSCLVSNNFSKQRETGVNRSSPHRSTSRCEPRRCKPSARRFGLPTDRLRSNFGAAEPRDETENRVQRAAHPGISI